MWLISNWPVGGNLPFKLKAGEFAIGRSKVCEIVLRDSSISRVHARLTVNPAGDLHLADLGSRNGTFLNDLRITITRPDPKDRVRLGAVALLFALEPPMHAMAEEDVEESTLSGGTLRLRKRKRPGADLTRPQKEVLQLIAQGKSEEDAAKLIGRSYHTVHNHLRAVYRAYDVHSRGELLAKLYEER